MPTPTIVERVPERSAVFYSPPATVNLNVPVVQTAPKVVTNVTKPVSTFIPRRTVT